MVSDSAFEDKLKELGEWIENHKWLPEEIGESESPWRKYEPKKVSVCKQNRLNAWTSHTQMEAEQLNSLTSETKGN